MSDLHSVTQWITDFKEGDSYATQRVYERYVGQLVRLACKKLRDLPRGIADEEDIAQSALKSFWHGVQRGRFPLLNDRNDLWRILLTIADRKVVDLKVRECRQKRGGGKPNMPLPADDLMPTEGEVNAVTHEVEHLLDLLNDSELRQIAVWKMEGYTSDEIAQKLQCVTRTVERKLRLIRKLWEAEFAS
jgi:DNA-directed RNA polymerase specialized sigma24 family protein